MLKTLRRPLLTALFLLSLLAVNSLWAFAGGQYHLDLITWPWKLGISVIGAACTTLIAAGSRKQVWVATALLAATLGVAAAVTYEAHLNEPGDEDDETTEQLTRSSGHATLVASAMGPESRD